MPVFTASGRISVKMQSSCSSRNCGVTSIISATFVVFCAVSACDRTHRIHTVCHHCLDVRLDTGSAARIASGDCKCCFHFHMHSSFLFLFTDPIDLFTQIFCRFFDIFTGKQTTHHCHTCHFPAFQQKNVAAVNASDCHHRDLHALADLL